MQTINHLIGRRLWIIRNYNVWGNAADVEFLYLGSETYDAEDRLFFGRTAINNETQDIQYADLLDWRGFGLPATINSPWIIVAPRSEYNAFVIGEQSSSGFRLGRDPSAPGAVAVDLYIYEMGGIS